MNEDELGQRLHDELHRRLGVPERAPEAVHEHLQNLKSMQKVRLGSSGSGSRQSRPIRARRSLLGLAAAISICALVGVGLFVRQSSQPAGSIAGPKDGIEAFGRVDSQTAWAESGADLYITRDAGATWSKGTLPGGRSPAQLFGVESSAATNSSGNSSTSYQFNTTYEPFSSGDTEIPISRLPTPTPEPVDLFPGHYYPDFIDADHGWLVSWTPSLVKGLTDYTMTAWRTSDGGQSWTPAPVPGRYWGLGVIQFVDASHGWITIVRTIMSVAPTPVSGPTPVVESTVPVADTTTILATSDGGVTWTMLSALASMAVPHFVSPTEAWGFASLDTTSTAIGVVHSTDGGKTWSTVALPLQCDGNLTGYANPPSEMVGVVEAELSCHGPSGFEVLRFTSTDGGATWTGEKHYATNSANGVSVNGSMGMLDLPAGQPFAFNSSGPGSLTGFSASFDGGASWMDYATDALPSEVALAEWTSPDDAWVMVRPFFTSTYELGGQLYATHDHGKTWTPLLGAAAPSASPAEASPTAEPSPTAVLLPSTKAIWSMGRVDEKTGWVLAVSSGSQTLLLTQDGGATWSERRMPEFAFQVQFVDATHGWAWSQEMGSGGQPTISDKSWRTTDGGLTWQEATIAVDTLPGQSVTDYGTSFHFRDVFHGEFFEVRSFGVGQASICARSSTSDGGATWSAAQAMPCLSSPVFESDQLGYATDASKPILYVTTDGGQTWTAGSTASGNVEAQGLEQEPDGTLRALVVSGAGRWTAEIEDSKDGGRTWTTVGPADGLPDNVQVSVVGDGHWFAADRGSGSMYLSTDDGLGWVSIGGESLPGPAGDWIEFVSPSDGWILSTSQTCEASTCQTDKYYVEATADGGRTWTTIFTQ